MGREGGREGGREARRESLLVSPSLYGLGEAHFVMTVFSGVARSRYRRSCSGGRIG